MEFFEVIPNKVDELDEFYQPIFEGLVAEFESNDHNLIPMENGKFGSLDSVIYCSRIVKDAFNQKDVKEFIGSLSDSIISDQNIQKAVNNFKMLESSSKKPSIEVLLLNYNKQPDNIENLFKLCDKYFFEKKYEQAFNLLLTNYSQLKDKNKEKVKKELLKYFDVLGNNHKQTNTFRRKLSSLLFS